MKKAVKGLIIAASVASVIGVAGVSFAAWQAGEDQSTTITGTTGSINTIGALTVTPADGTYTTGEDSAIIMNALYPVDQGDSYLTYWEFVVTATGEGSQAFKLTGEIKKGDDGTEVGTAALYWTNTQPTASTEAVEANKLSTTAATITPDATSHKVYVYMIATGTAAMKADITLTFSATAA